MANRIPNIDDFSIPSELFNEHERIVDWFLDGELASLCTINYPPSDSECTNCIYDPDTNCSANIYKVGGPYPFENRTLCPMCGGIGKLTLPVTDIIRLRVYYGASELNASMQQFMKLNGTDFNTATGLVYIIGYANDLPKFKRSQSITIPNPSEEIVCKRFSSPIGWGFRKNRYFACMLQIT